MIDYLTLKTMRDNGMGYGAIAKELGVKRSVIANRCRKWNLTGERDHQQSNGVEVFEYLKQANLEYVSGDINTKANVIVKELKCGHVHQVNMRTVYQKLKGYKGITLSCPVCAEIAKKQKEDAAALERFQREWAREHKPERFRQLRMKTCKRCGNVFIGSTLYCSNACMKRMMDSNKEARRRIRMRKQMVDKDISLEVLYKRDNGKCYLCGKICDWNDITEKDGTLIAGATYPSIDHVVPLSKGGKHSWDNVRLACRECNGKKSDKLYPLGSKTV